MDLVETGADRRLQVSNPFCGLELMLDNLSRFASPCYRTLGLVSTTVAINTSLTHGLVP